MTIPYIMIHGDIGFCPIAKNASSSMSLIFENHTYHPIHEPLPSNIKLKFVIIRNPTERLISYYLMLKEKRLVIIANADTLTFDEFLKETSKELQKELPDQHVRKQVYWINLLSKDFIKVRMDNLDKFLIDNNLPSIRDNVNSLPQFVPTPEQLNDITEMYKEDIILYKSY